jgi:signal transduction histidine kinase
MKFYIQNLDNESIVSNLEEACIACFDNCNTNGSKVPQCKIGLSQTKRYGKLVSEKGTIFLCCSKTKTSKLFKEKLEILKYTIPSFFKINSLATIETSKKSQENFNRIVHNLRKINAQNIQQLYDLVPQSLLTENIDNQLQIIHDHILQEPQKAAKMFLRIAKNCSSIRSEFIVYDKLHIDNPNLSLREHKIQSIILNVYHPFEQEFQKKNVKLRIETNTKKILLDYDTVRVALFHIFGNAVKYTKQRSILDITFNDSDKELNVSFQMTSLYISINELSKLFEDTYSGVNARKIHKEGTGMGMGIIKRALELNNAELIIIPGSKIIKDNGIDYADNDFIIKFNKLPQDD